MYIYFSDDKKIILLYILFFFGVNVRISSRGKRKGHIPEIKLYLVLNAVAVIYIYIYTDSGY